MTRDENQIEFFPVPVTVARLDARALLGASTRVKGVWRVQIPGEPRPHQVYHDRYGWYCEEHGKECRAVRHAQRRK